LLQNDGKTYKEIADFIGCGYRTVPAFLTN